MRRPSGIVFPSGSGGSTTPSDLVAPEAGNQQKEAETPPAPTPVVDANPNGGTP